MAQALAHQVGLKGYDIVYVNTATMLTSFAPAILKGTHARKLKRVVRLPVLVLDDLDSGRSETPMRKCSTMSSLFAMNRAPLS